jgi:hypothetical protein
MAPSLNFWEEGSTFGSSPPPLSGLVGTIGEFTSLLKILTVSVKKSKVTITLRKNGSPRMKPYSLSGDLETKAIHWVLSAWGCKYCVAGMLTVKGPSKRELNSMERSSRT